MKHAVRQLGYIGLNATDPAKWAEFGSHLGAAVRTHDDGTVSFRLDDDRDSRITVHPADEDGLAYAGWEVFGPDALRSIQDSLESRGVTTSHSPEIAVQRGVEEVLTFTDPDGNPGELYWGAGTAVRTQFISPHGVAFELGDMGAGHLTFGVADFRRTHDFYTEVLGMRLTEIADVGGARVGFLRCNPRHHSVAFAQLPSGSSRLLHLSVEVAELDAMGAIRDRLLDARFPIARDLGRHPTDGVISMYIAVAPGYDFELGCGSIQVDEKSWEHDRYDRVGWSWGHREVTSYGETTSLGDTESQR